MGGWGKCPCCRKYTDLTEHHDKDEDKKFMICRECHDVLEAYIQLVDTHKKSVSGQAPEQAPAATDA